MPSHPPATSSEAALQENVAVSSERLRSLAGSSRVQPSRRSIKKKPHIRIFLTFFFCPSAHHLHTVCLLRFGLSRRDKRGQNCHAGCGASDAFAQSGQRSLSKALAPDPLLQPPQLVCLFFFSASFKQHDRFPHSSVAKPHLLFLLFAGEVALTSAAVRTRGRD